MSDILRGNIYAFIAAIIWGGSFVCIRTLAGALDGVTLYLARFTLGFLGLLPLWILRKRRRGDPLLPRDRASLGWLALYGILSGPAYHLPLYFGSAGIGAGMMAMLIATQPVLAAAMEIALGRRRPRARFLAGIAVAAGGAVILVLARHGGADAFGTKHLIYPLAVLIAAVAGAACTLVSHAATRRMDAVTLTTASIPFGMVLAAGFLPAGAFGSLAALDAGGWTSLLYLTVPALVVAGLLWVKAIQILSPGRVIVYLYLMPLVSVAAGWVLLGERLPAGFWPAGGMVMIGLYMVNSTPRETRKGHGNTDEGRGS